MKKMVNDETIKQFVLDGDSQMLEEIQKNLKQRMANYNDSRQPTDDEVRIAWLLSEIERLNEKMVNLTSFQKID